MGTLLLLVLCAWCVIALIIVVLIYKNKGASAPGSTGGTVSTSRAPTTPRLNEPDPTTEDGLFQQTQATAERIKAHMKAKYGNDPRTKRLLATFKKMTKMSKSQQENYGEQFANTITISMWETATKLRTTAHLNNTLVHEMGHAIEADESAEHGPKWKAAYLWLANIAANEMGLPVRVLCWDCNDFKVCSRSQCPKCLWDCGK